MAKRFLRKSGVAARYSVDERTVDRMSQRDDGRLPPPHYRGRIPLWDEDELDESDRATALIPRPPRATEAA